MDAGEPVVLLGDSGTGKSHYAEVRIMPILPWAALSHRVIKPSRSA
jgi:ABC-type microcin C transport system duplicated ATPase subunit YejF